MLGHAMNIAPKLLGVPRIENENNLQIFLEIQYLYLLYKFNFLRKKVESSVL